MKISETSMKIKRSTHHRQLTINDLEAEHRTQTKFNWTQNLVWVSWCGSLFGNGNNINYSKKKVRKCTSRFLSLFAILLAFVLLAKKQQTQAAPRLSVEDDNKTKLKSYMEWPQLVQYDIWNTSDSGNKFHEQEVFLSDNLVDDEGDGVFSNSHDSISATSTTETLSTDSSQANSSFESMIARKSRVIHLFPVPVDGECLADDGRRTGSCFNPYECRAKGGSAKGECAMGFGVCCIFTVSCNETISNNITYIVSPNFPSFMPNNFTLCKYKLKLLSNDISQLRIDFHHFSLGQPNRRTGKCEGDAFNISGGPAGTFLLCGQNSGQHIYYDISGRSVPRQQPHQLQSQPLYGSLSPLTYEQLYGNSTEQIEPNIEITMRFSNRFLPIRLWEIRISQIPFSQRAPAGCLQYHTGIQGIIQTFNFAENGRHLANQHYRICMRQEMEMCSIVYEPCDEQSFRIGPSRGTNFSMNPANAPQGQPIAINDVASNTSAEPDIVPSSGTMPIVGMMPTETIMTTNSGMMPVNNNQNDDIGMVDAITETTSSTMTTETLSSPPNSASSPASTAMSTDAVISTEASTTSSSATTTPSTAAPTRATTPTTTTTRATTITTTTTTSTTTVEPSLADDVEGSGDDNDNVTPSSFGVSRIPRPVSGGFDLFGFLRSAFDFTRRRQRAEQRSSNQHIRNSRQFYSICTDRITMPCIIEDFIGTGFSPLPGCEPVHCGSQFCSNGVWPCRIESTVTPFYIGVHFGNGQGKGSAEDNIGVCLRYAQVQCI